VSVDGSNPCVWDTDTGGCALATCGDGSTHARVFCDDDTPVAAGDAAGANATADGDGSSRYCESVLASQASAAAKARLPVIVGASVGCLLLLLIIIVVVLRRRGRHNSKVGARPSLHELCGMFAAHRGTTCMGTYGGNRGRLRLVGGYFGTHVWPALRHVIRYLPFMLPGAGHIC